MGTKIFQLGRNSLLSPRHDKFGRFDEERRPLTVCLATLFRWNYANLGQPADWQRAAIVASDRLLTVGDVQYEPAKQKVFYLPKGLIVVADEMELHSQALKELLKGVSGDFRRPADEIATRYAHAMQGIRVRQAEIEILVPLGMNTDTFASQQQDLSPLFVERTEKRMQAYSGDVVGEALVIAAEADGVSLYYCNSAGQISCLDDIGFGTIGLGGWHAKSRLMESAYTSDQTIFAAALAATYSAKKSAELAPGVGKKTDLHLVGKYGPLHIEDHYMDQLESLYQNYETKRRALASKAIIDLQGFISSVSLSKVEQSVDGQARQSDKTNAAAHGGDVEGAAKAARGNENWPEEAAAS
jgi:hypothetical protein